MVSTTPVAALKDVKVHFATGSPGETVKALDGVSLEVAQGDSLGVIGESGSGKSTLARVMVGLLRPDTGSVHLGGVDLSSLSAAQRRQRQRWFQIVFQDPHAALNPRMRIMQSVREPLDVSGVGATAAERRDLVIAMLERVGLSGGLAQRFPHELSGGQKQRINIARALILGPRLLIADEATAALDVSVQADILNLYLDLRRDLNLTFVCITHDLPVALHMSQAIAVMYLGIVVEYAPAERLRSQCAHPYTHALLASEPKALPKRLQAPARTVLQGEIPSPIRPPSGCRFRTRCPIAQPVCAEAVPPLRPVGPAHRVACHFPLATMDMSPC